MRAIGANPVSYRRFAGAESLVIGIVGIAYEYVGNSPALEVLLWI
jgi:hypothetical protein